MENLYRSFESEILEVIPHTRVEYTFRMAYRGEVRPGQFFEVSIPGFGEAPISVSGITSDSVDLTIRRVGAVTNEIFEHWKGARLLMRGPYGNGFDVTDLEGKDIVVMTGGTGAAPVRGVVEYYWAHPEKRGHMSVIASYKYESDILFRADYERWKQNMDVIVTLSREKEAGNYALGRGTKHIAALPMENRENTMCVVVGPQTLMDSTAAELIRAGYREENILISLERRMCCGLGKCGHCRVGSRYICLDGPVFRYTEAKDLVD